MRGKHKTKAKKAKKEQDKDGKECKAGSDEPSRKAWPTQTVADYESMRDNSDMSQHPDHMIASSSMADFLM